MSSKTITFDDIVNIGKRRVNDTITVEVPALGGSVVIRQISGAEHDAAVALGGSGADFNQHAVARAQIIAALVEPALPEDEAEAIIDNLPVDAFGQLHSLVTAHCGINQLQVRELERMFRLAKQHRDSARNREDGDHAGDALDGDGLGSTDADAGDEVEGVLPLAADGAEDSAEAAGAAPEDEGEVTA